MTITELAPLARARFGARVALRVTVFSAGIAGSVLRMPAEGPVEVLADVIGWTEADVLAQLEGLLADGSSTAPAQELPL